MPTLDRPRPGGLVFSESPSPGRHHDRTAAQASTIIGLTAARRPPPANLKFRLDLKFAYRVRRSAGESITESWHPYILILYPISESGTFLLKVTVPD